jgi:hypothetical protein
MLQVWPLNLTLQAIGVCSFDPGDVDAQGDWRGAGPGDPGDSVAVCGLFSIALDEEPVDRFFNVTVADRGGEISPDFDIPQSAYVVRVRNTDGCSP